MTPSAQIVARRAVLRTFRWESGHADVWRVFADADALAAVVNGLVDPWREERITQVVGVESRGFLLGSAVAVALGAGFVAVRKAGTLFPGPTASVQVGGDYRGHRHLLRIQQQVLTTQDRVLLVDDRAEHGSQARAARALVESCQAHFVGVALLVDQLEGDVRAALGRVTSVVRADEH